MRSGQYPPNFLPHGSAHPYFHFGRSRLRRSHTNESSVPALIFELHEPGHQRVQRIVLALPNIYARLVLRSALANQNRPGINKLPAEALDAQPLPM